MNRYALLFLSCLLTHLVAAQNQKPQISGPARFDLMAGEKACVTFSSGDADFPDSLTFGWIDLPADVQVNTNNGQVRHPAMEICWTPHDSLASKTPYSFRIWLKDNAAPLADTVFRTVQVFVRGLPAVVNKTFVPGNCGFLKLTVEVNEWTTGIAQGIRDESGKLVGNASHSFDTSIQLYPGKFVIQTIAQDVIPFAVWYYDTVTVETGIQVGIDGKRNACFNEVVELKAKTSGKDTSLTYHWWIVDDTSFEDTHISDSFLVFIMANTVGFQCRITDTSGCLYQASHKVGKVLCSGLEEMEPGWTCYPNPAQNVLYINATLQKETRWTLTGISGTMVQEQPHLLHGEQSVDLSGLPAGVYFLRLYSVTGEIARFKVVHY